MERLLASLATEGEEQNIALVYVKATADGHLIVHLDADAESTALTQEQLLASGLGTAQNQLAQIGYLADLAGSNDAYANYKLRNTEDLGEGVKYTLKSDGANWLLIKKTYTDTSAALTYGSQKNNANLTTAAAAWANRATVVCGELSDA